MNKGFQLLFKHIPSGCNNEDDTVTLTGTIEQFEKAMDEYAALKNIESSSRIIHSKPQDRCYYWVKRAFSKQYEVAMYVDLGDYGIFENHNGLECELSNISDWKQTPIPKANEAYYG